MLSSTYHQLIILLLLLALTMTFRIYQVWWFWCKSVTVGSGSGCRPWCPTSLCSSRWSIPTIGKVSSRRSADCWGLTSSQVGCIKSWSPTASIRIPQHVDFEWHIRPAEFIWSWQILTKWSNPALRCYDLRYDLLWTRRSRRYDFSDYPDDFSGPLAYDSGHSSDRKQMLKWFMWIQGLDSGGSSFWHWLPLFSVASSISNFSYFHPFQSISSIM